jgi:hypothetical protein
MPYLLRNDFASAVSAKEDYSAVELVEAPEVEAADIVLVDQEALVWP